MSCFNFLNLDCNVRSFMLQEVERDIKSKALFFSVRFNDKGRELYPTLLKEAIENSNEVELEHSLCENKCFKQVEKTKDGKERRVPSNAAKSLAQNEFNRFYIRAVCLRALELNIKDVTVYRARMSSRSRAESDRLIGTKLSAAELLEDLRNSIGETPQMLPHINSGLSIKI